MLYLYSSALVCMQKSNQANNCGFCVYLKTNETNIVNCQTQKVPFEERKKKSFHEFAKSLRTEIFIKQRKTKTFLKKLTSAARLSVALFLIFPVIKTTDFLLIIARFTEWVRLGKDI